MKFNPNKNFCVITMHAYHTIWKLNPNVNLKYKILSVSCLKFLSLVVLQVVCMYAYSAVYSYVRFSYHQFLCMLVCDIAWAKWMIVMMNVKSKTVLFGPVHFRLYVLTDIHICSCRYNPKIYINCAVCCLNTTLFLYHCLIHNFIFTLKRRMKWKVIAWLSFYCSQRVSW